MGDLPYQTVDFFHQQYGWTLRFCSSIVPSLLTITTGEHLKGELTLQNSEPKLCGNVAAKALSL